MPTSPINAIVASYRDPVIKAYSQVRFIILRQAFLEELDQWLPKEGRVLDLGSGFGLFSLYFATTQPKRHVVGVELNAKRVKEAQRSAEQLGLRNVEYHNADVLEWEAAGQFDAIYMLDVVHHLPREGVQSFLGRLSKLLKPGGIMLIKDVSDRPRYKMWVTLALDRLMVGREPIHYWSPQVLAELLTGLGFEVKRHTMNDVLPYPHVLYICTRT